MKIRHNLLKLSLLFAIAAPLDSRAEVHGPFCSWYRDPTTTMTIQWVDQTHTGGAVEGEEGLWFEGNAGFGYSDGDDATRFEMKDRFTALYIRTAFDLPEGTEPDAEVLLEILYDDAFIAYLNGTEVTRAGIAGGSGATVRGVKSHDANNKFERFSLGSVSKLLKPGVNVLAVEGHNVKLDSSDFSLHPTLSIKGSGGGAKEMLVDKLTPWQYLANGDPELSWNKTMGEAERAPNDPNSSAQAAFSLSYKAVGGVSFADATITSQPFANTRNKVYFADLSGLKPATRYEARFSTPAGETQELVFETAPAELADSLQFVTGGDMYHNEKLLDSMNSRCGKLDPLFALLGGDLAYANGRSADKWYYWIDSWAEHAVAPSGRMIPMIVAIGNHEIDTQEAQPRGRHHAPFFYSLFKLPEDVSNYTVDFGAYMSLVILDSDHSQPVKDQTPWLETALSERSGIPHMFVCYHRPTYGTPVKVQNYNVRNQWVPLFEKYRVDAVFENDHHVYKRTHLIFQDKKDDEKGVLYIGDGAWGVRTREIPAKKARALDYLEEFSSTNHLLNVTLNGETIQIDSIEAYGRTFDKVTLPVRRKPTE